MLTAQHSTAQLTVTHADGTVDTYKIVDRR